MKSTKSYGVQHRRLPWLSLILARFPQSLSRKADQIYQKMKALQTYLHHMTSLVPSTEFSDSAAAPALGILVSSITASSVPISTLDVTLDTSTTSANEPLRR